jgi:hypothetical protein
MVMESKMETQQPKTYNTGDSLVVTDPTTDPALKSLSFWVRGVKKQVAPGPKNGASFPLLVLSVSKNGETGCAAAP